jgi:hypothetical protein
MERKLVKQGRDALTVTLPSKWLKDKGLKAGQCVNIDLSGNALKITADSVGTLKEITVDVRDEERGMIWHIMLGKYIDGFDKITILHNNSEVMQSFPSGLLGMIVEEHTRSRTVLKSIISLPENNVNTIIRRVVHMFEE